MYEMDRLRDELTHLFRARMTEAGEPAENVKEYLGNIDFHALTQAVRDKARTVYAYTTQGQHEKSFSYRGEELFHQRATLLYEEMDQSIVSESVHRLIHATNPETIRKYLQKLNLDAKQLRKLNKLRSLANVENCLICDVI